MDTLGDFSGTDLRLDEQMETRPLQLLLRK